MTNNTIKKIHRWYSWVLAAVLIALGVLLVLSCLDIYMSGPRPYSAEAIGIRFHRIAIPVIVALIGIAGGIALNLLLPVEGKRPKAASSAEDIMLRLRQKTDLPPVQKEIRLRFVLRTVTTLCFIGLMIYPLIYFLTPEHFSISELNKDVIQAVLVALLPATFGLLICWLCRTLVNRSFRREAAIYKDALAKGRRASLSKATKQPQNSQSMLNTLRIVIGIVAIIFVVLGILNGGADDVLKKAIAICTECIGLG